MLTYEEWLKIWLDSGHFKERGRGKGKYCMARFGDKGPYKVGNVYIAKYTHNCKNQNPTPHTDEFKAALAERNHNRIWTDQARAKIGVSKTGVIQSEETRALKSQSGKKAWKEGRFANRKTRNQFMLKPSY